VIVNVATTLNARDAPCGNVVGSFPGNKTLFMQLPSPAAPTANCSAGSFKWDAVQETAPGSGRYWYVAESFLSPCPPKCPDGILEQPESCDDNNTRAGDGCSNCQVEANWFCSNAAPNVPSTCSQLVDSSAPAASSQTDIVFLSSSQPPEPGDTETNPTFSDGPSGQNIGSTSGKKSNFPVIPVAVGAGGGILLLFVASIVVTVIVKRRKRHPRHVEMHQGTGKAEHYKPFSQVAAAANATPAQGNERGPNWQEHDAPDGTKYYYNQQTGESRWTKLF